MADARACFRWAKRQFWAVETILAPVNLMINHLGLTGSLVLLLGGHLDPFLSPPRKTLPARFLMRS